MDKVLCFFKRIMNPKRINKKILYTGGALLFILLIAFLTFGPLNTPLLSKLGETILRQGEETKGIADTIGIERKEIKKEEDHIVEEAGDEKGETENKEKTIVPVYTPETVYTPSYNPPVPPAPVVTPPVPEEEPKCSEGTIAEYNRQINIYTELKEYYIETAERIFTEDTLRCQNDYTYCVSQIYIPLRDYDRAHQNCYLSGACQRDRENLETDLNRACENTRLTCIDNAKIKQSNYSGVIESTRELASYVRLLAGCL